MSWSLFSYLLFKSSLFYLTKEPLALQSRLVCLPSIPPVCKEHGCFVTNSSSLWNRLPSNLKWWFYCNLSQPLFHHQLKIIPVNWMLRTLSRWMHLCTKVLILYRTTGAISMCKCSICQHSWSQTILRFFNKRIWNIHVIKAQSNHALIILQFCCAIQGYILSNINQTVSKLGYYITN